MSFEVQHRNQHEPSTGSDDTGPSGLAWTTLALGIGSWIFLPFVGAVAALICGVVERRKIAEGTSSSDGETPVLIGMGVAGAQLVLTVLSILFFVAVFFVYASGHQS